MLHDPNNHESFMLEAMLGFNVNRAAHLMSEAIAERFRARGFALTAQDFGILYRLWREDGLKQQQIAASMARDKTTITRRLDGLVRKRLIERRADPSDRRVFRIHLTHAGRAAMQHLIDAVQRFHTELLADIPKEDRQTTIRTLQTISHNITGGSNS